MDKNTTVVFPAPLMTTIAELGTFLARETAAASPTASMLTGPVLATGNGTNPVVAATANGAAEPA